MQDFERRLRDSLQARAQDVEPTPELWRRVEAKVNRRQRWTWVASVAGVAAAIAAAVVVIPNLLDDGITPDVVEPPATVAPTTNPTDEPTEQPPGATVPEGWVTTDGVTIVLHGADGSTRTLYEQPAEGEVTIEAVEVRPGSTTDDLTVVYLVSGEGMWELRYLTLRDGEVSWDYLPGRLQVSTEVTPDARPVPAFSPDGAHLAWLETRRGEENQVPTLVVIGWTDDGPGTGDAATDNATFAIDAIPVIEHPGGFVVEDWVWDPHDVEGQVKDGLLYVTGGAEAWTIPISEQTDGAVALDPQAPVQLLEVEDAAVIDAAAVEGGRWLLTAAGAGEEEVTWQLRFEADQGQDRTLDPGLPTNTVAPPDAWMTALGDHLLVGFGPSTSNLIAPDGSRTALPQGTTYADFLR